MENRMQGLTEVDRLPYHEPAFREHGTVQEITQASGYNGNCFDGCGYAPQDTPHTS